MIWRYRLARGAGCSILHSLIFVILSIGGQPRIPDGDMDQMVKEGEARTRAIIEETRKAVERQNSQISN
jgi:hypothetical protein